MGRSTKYKSKTIYIRIELLNSVTVTNGKAGCWCAGPRREQGCGLRRGKLEDALCLATVVLVTPSISVCACWNVGLLGW